VQKRLPDKSKRKEQKVGSTQDIIDKIRTLETEKKSLFIEIEELKKAADVKASALESEVSALRDEMRLLTIMMNVSDAHTSSKMKSGTNAKHLKAFS
jgi:hypothetical protein